MPIVRTIQVLQLGRVPDLDPNESRVGAENATSLMGRVFGNAENPLWATKTDMTITDGNSDGLVPFADRTISPPGEYVRVNGQNHSVDTGITYMTQITYSDGTTGTGVLRLIQDGSGNLYLVPPSRDAQPNEIAAATSKPMVSFRILSLSRNDFTHLSADRYGLPDDPTFPCFCAGTMIMTRHGLCAVEDLQVGDSVYTKDHGFQRVRWIGAKTLGAGDLAQNPKLAPVRIGKGALGADLPQQDLLVSQQHRVLVQSKIARNMFGTDEVLVAAKHLTGLNGIMLAADLPAVSYVHILFDGHEIIQANGVLTESLYVGKQALSTVGQAVRDEIFAIFPELENEGFGIAPARPFLSGRQGRNLVTRHIKKNRSLIGELHS